MTGSCLPPTRTSKRLADRLIVVSLFLRIQFNIVAIRDRLQFRGGSVLGQPSRSNAAPAQSGAIGELLQSARVGRRECRPRRRVGADPGFASREYLGHGTLPGSRRRVANANF